MDVPKKDASDEVERTVLAVETHAKKKTIHVKDDVVTDADAGVTPRVGQADREVMKKLKSVSRTQEKKTHVKKTKQKRKKEIKKKI